MDEADLTVAAVESVGTDTVAVEVESPPGFTAQPGQFVKLTFETADGPEARFYTVSSPDVEGTFEVTVEVDPGDDVGGLLDGLSAGDSVRVSGPFGRNYYDGEDPAIVLAGGPGVGAAVAIAERALADGHEAVVVYRADDPVHAERIAALREAGVTVAVPDTDAALTAAVGSALAEHGRDSQLFVYGFAPFVDAATAAIEGAGGRTDAAKVENFG
jgi:3-phenylpropionate/trans-cinnamate dioxygenase ferredoxin reductase subunit